MPLNADRNRCAFRIWLLPVVAARGICRPASGDRLHFVDPNRFARPMPTTRRTPVRGQPSYLRSLRTLFASGVTFFGRELGLVDRPFRAMNRVRVQELHRHAPAPRAEQDLLKH